MAGLLKTEFVLGLGSDTGADVRDGDSAWGGELSQSASPGVGRGPCSPPGKLNQSARRSSVDKTFISVDGTLATVLHRALAAKLLC